VAILERRVVPLPIGRLTYRDKGRNDKQIMATWPEMPLNPPAGIHISSYLVLSPCPWGTTCAVQRARATRRRIPPLSSKWSRNARHANIWSLSCSGGRAESQSNKEKNFTTLLQRVEKRTPRQHLVPKLQWSSCREPERQGEELHELPPGQVWPQHGALQRLRQQQEPGTQALAAALRHGAG